MIVVTVKVDWGQETIQEILPELKKHFKTEQWGHFSGIMEKYPPRSIDVKTYDASETKHALDD